MPISLEKDSDATLDFKFDFAPLTNGNTEEGMTDYLEAGEIINSYSLAVTAVTTGCLPNIVDNYLSGCANAVTAWVTGGEKFKEFNLTCSVVTSSSPVARHDDRTIKIKIVNK
jgi:hypothetical protein